MPRMRGRWRDHFIALGAVAAVAALSAALWQSPTFRLFFGWPNGGTWSNTIAWLEALALAGFASWYLRDHIGRGLVGWLGKHHKPHLQDQLAEHHEQLAQEFEQVVDRQMTEVRSALRALHRRLDGE